MQTIPIVLVHMGDSFYLKYTIENIKRFNPLAKAYLVCEGLSTEYDGITKFFISDYSKYARRLEKIYVHKNTSNPEVELFCLRRWLILKDFMEKKSSQKYSPWIPM